MNINGLVVNNKYCGVVDEKGNIRVLTKKNDNARENFRDYLELENAKELQKDKIIEKKEELKSNKRNLFLNIIQLVISLGAFLAIGINLPMLVIIKMILLLSSFVFAKISINKVLVQGKLEKELNSLKSEYNEIKSDLQKIDGKMNIAGSWDNVYEPKISSRSDISKSIIDSSKALYAVVMHYSNPQEEITDVKRISLSNFYFDNSKELINVPDHDKIMECEKILLDNRKASINELLSLRFQYLNAINSQKEIKNNEYKLMLKRG